MRDLWESWLLIAFLAPCLWAIVTLIDVYFVQGLYRDEWDGTLISGAFQMLPWIFVPLGFIDFATPTSNVVYFALAGGFCFLASFFFYFRALFRFGDAPMIHVLWNLAVLVVPLLSWIWASERLILVQYFGIFLAFLGSSVFVSRKGMLRDGFLRIIGPMTLAVILLSVSMVLQKEAYSDTSARFMDVFLLFSLGAGLAAAALALLNPRDAVKRFRRYSTFDMRFISLFIVAEIISVFGTIFSQRAIDLAPSVSFVVVIESSMPIFVMIFSILLSAALHRSGSMEMAMIFRNQVLAWREKTFAIILMASGIYCVAR